MGGDFHCNLSGLLCLYHRRVVNLSPPPPRAPTRSACGSASAERSRFTMSIVQYICPYAQPAAPPPPKQVG